MVHMPQDILGAPTPVFMIAAIASGLYYEHRIGNHPLTGFLALMTASFVSFCWMIIAGLFHSPLEYLGGIIPFILIGLVIFGLIWDAFENGDHIRWSMLFIPFILLGRLIIISAVSLFRLISKERRRPYCRAGRNINHQNNNNRSADEPPMNPRYRK